MNAIVKYPGSKWSLAEWIIGHFPPHHRELKDWYRETAMTTDQLSRRRQEILWMNFQPAKQETLFHAEAFGVRTADAQMIEEGDRHGYFAQGGTPAALG